MTAHCHVFINILQTKNTDRDGLVAHLNAKGIPWGVLSNSFTQAKSISR